MFILLTQRYTNTKIYYNIEYLHYFYRRPDDIGTAIKTASLDEGEVLETPTEILKLIAEWSN